MDETIGDRDAKDRTLESRDESSILAPRDAEGLAAIFRRMKMEQPKH